MPVDTVVVGAVITCCVGLLIEILSLFLPQWRVDKRGSRIFADNWYYQGFDTRAVGLVQVRGTFAQSWSTISRATCDHAEWIYMGSALQHIGNQCGGGGSETCNVGYAEHMMQRCTQYQTVHTVNNVVIGLTFLAVIMGIAAALVAFLSKTKKTGGLSLGLWLVGSFLTLCSSLIWLLVTAMAFDKLVESSTYPFPGIGYGYYMHLAGTCTVTTGAIVFGVRVMPKVWSYDPEREKAMKRQEFLQRMMAKYALRQQQRGAFPPPPGYKNAGPPPAFPNPSAPPPGGSQGPSPQGYAAGLGPGYGPYGPQQGWSPQQQSPFPPMLQHQNPMTPEQNFVPPPPPGWGGGAAPPPPQQYYQMGLDGGGDGRPPQLPPTGWDGGSPQPPNVAAPPGWGGGPPITGHDGSVYPKLGAPPDGGVYGQSGGMRGYQDLHPHGRHDTAAKPNHRGRDSWDCSPSVPPRGYGQRM